MPTFDYSAYDSTGKLISGVISADSERQARRLIKDKKLLPSKLNPVSEKAARGVSSFGGQARVDSLDLSL